MQDSALTAAMYQLKAIGQALSLYLQKEQATRLFVSHTTTAITKWLQVKHINIASVSRT